MPNKSKRTQDVPQQNLNAKNVEELFKTKQHLLPSTLVPNLSEKERSPHIRPEVNADLQQMQEKKYEGIKDHIQHGMNDKLPLETNPIEAQAVISENLTNCILRRDFWNYHIDCQENEVSLLFCSFLFSFRSPYPSFIEVTELCLKTKYNNSYAISLR